MKNVDYSSHGQMNYTEFLLATLDLKRVLTEDILFSAFKHFDVENSGFITAANLAAAFSRAGYEFNEKEVNDMVNEFGLKNGKIDFEEFRTILRKFHSVQTDTASPQQARIRRASQQTMLREIDTTETVRSCLTPRSAAVQGRKVFSQAVAVSPRPQALFPIPVFRPKRRSPHTVLSARDSGRPQGHKAARAARTERTQTAKTESSRPPRRAKGFKSRVDHKPNKDSKEEAKPVLSTLSIDRSTSTQSMRQLIVATLRHARKERERRASELLERQMRQASRRAELSAHNQLTRTTNLKRFKTKSFRPKVAWGADERKVLGITEEILRAQAKEERERHKTAGSKSRLGLETFYQVRSEVLAGEALFRSVSSVPSPELQECRQMHTPDPSLQSYMRYKKRKQAEAAFAAALDSQEAETRRISQLRELDSRARKQLDRYKARQGVRRHRRKRRRPQTEDEEVKMIMEQIDEEPGKEDAIEGRECRLFGIVEDPVSPPPVNATRLCGVVLDRISSLSQAQQAPGSVSLPEILRPVDPVEETSEVERHRQEIRKRLEDLRARAERIREGEDRSSGETVREERTSMREEASGEPLQPSSASPKASTSPRPTGFPAQHSSASLGPEEVREQLNRVKEEELRQLRTIAEQMKPENQSEWELVAKIVESRYALISKWLGLPESPKPGYTELSDLLSAVSHTPPLSRPVVDYLPPSPDEEHSVQSPDLSEIHHDNSDLPFSFCEPTARDRPSPIPTDSEAPHFPVQSYFPYEDWDGVCPEPQRDAAVDFVTEAIVSQLMAEAADIAVAGEVAREVLSRLISEITLKAQPATLESMVQFAFAEGLEGAGDIEEALETSLQCRPLEVLATLMETEIGQVRGDAPTATAVLPPTVLTHLQETFAESEYQQCLSRLCYNSMNECLDTLRPFGLRGAPQPWSSRTKEVYIPRSFPVLQERVEERIRRLSATKIGLLGDDERAREANLSKALKDDMLAYDQFWTDYEWEETQVRLDLAESLLDSLVRETMTVLAIR